MKPVNSNYMSPDEYFRHKLEKLKHDRRKVIRRRGKKLIYLKGD